MAKQTIEGRRVIDIEDWNLSPGRSRSWSWPDGTSVIGEIQKFQIVMRYQYREAYGKEESIEEVIPIDWTLSRLGREKFWFQCPGCGMRAATLFFGKNFRCRRCLGLVYRSQKENPQERALSRIQKNRMKLGGSSDLLASFPPKPPGMHWSTYLRKKAEDEKAVAQYIEYFRLTDKTRA
jgi:hypothetical protein